MSDPLRDRLVFQLSPPQITPYETDISDKNLYIRRTILDELQEYDFNRIKGDKTKQTYSLEMLKNIARILGINQNQNKNVLADEIRTKWLRLAPGN